MRLLARARHARNPPQPTNTSCARDVLLRPSIGLGKDLRLRDQRVRERGLAPAADIGGPQHSRQLIREIHVTQQTRAGRCARVGVLGVYEKT